MGVTLRRVLTALAASVVALAAPQLQLATTAIGPFEIAVGQNGQTQTVEAANIGDGTIVLAATSNAAWLTASVGSVGACSFASSCYPVRIGLATSALAAGMYTGVVTINDPNAVDAPQTITVTVEIGGGVPSSLDLYVAPGGSASSSFETNSVLTTAATQPGSGTSLSLTMSGGGSFSFALSYTVTVAAASSASTGVYPGGVNVTGATFQPDIKNVPVNVHVTSQPIASLSAPQLSFAIAQNAASAAQSIAVTNTGLGTLTVTGATAPASATWLTLATSGNVVTATANPAGLSPGPYATTMTIASNAANGPLTISIQLQVLTTGPAVAAYQGVVDNGLFEVGNPVAQGGIVAIFGQQFTAGAPVGATTLPLGTSLGQATVYVNGEAAPVYYVSATQINFQIPYDTTPGQAIVHVDVNGQRGNLVSVQVAPAVPRLLAFTSGSLAGYAIAQFGDGVTFPVPPTPGVPTRAASAGDVLVFYALGLGATVPSVASGQAAPTQPLAKVPNVQVVFDQLIVPNTGITTTPQFAGLTPNFVGLYQINVQVPAGTPVGPAIPVFIIVGNVISNSVYIDVQ